MFLESMMWYLRSVFVSVGGVVAWVYGVG